MLFALLQCCSVAELLGEPSVSQLVAHAVAKMVAETATQIASLKKWLEQGLECSFEQRLE